MAKAAFRLAGVALALFMMGSIVGCGSGEADKEGLTRVTIGTLESPVSAMLYIAEERGFFEDQGLDVELKAYGSGGEALAALIDGEVDYATAAQTPLARAALKGADFVILATLNESDHVNYIVARKDRGISTAEDLVGKRIGVFEGTSAHFFLDTYLVTKQIEPGTVTMVPIKPQDAVASVVDGKVDGIAAFDPYVLQIERQLKNNATVLAEPSIYTQSWNFASMRETVKADPEIAERLLQAFDTAEQFVLDNPDESRNIAATRVRSMSAEDVKTRWDDYRWYLRLDQTLVLSLEDQARWIIESTEGTQGVPAFLEHVESAPLAKVRPSAVNLVTVP